MSTDKIRIKMTRFFRLLVSVLAFATATAIPRPDSSSSYHCQDGLCYELSNGEKRLTDCAEIGYVCCRGAGINIWNLTAQSNGLSCCPGSGQLYNPALEVCDDEQIRNKRPNERQCGLTAVYDESTQKCCKKSDSVTRVYPKEGKCCQEINLTDPDEDCCEGEVYSISRQTCCVTESYEYKLYDIPNGACCHNIQPYSPLYQECTDEYGVINKSPNQRSKCVNDLGETVLYNNETELCCLGEVRSKDGFLCYKERRPIPKTNARDNEVCFKRTEDIYVTFFNGPGQHQVCHNGEIIRLQKDEGLCGYGSDHTRYNTTTDLCCYEVRRHKNAKVDGMKCCGKDKYNPHSQICCHHKVNRTISETAGGRCCASEAFNSRTHKCTPGYQVEPIVCHKSNKPPYPERCALTDEKFGELRRAFLEKGYYFYVATVNGIPDPEAKTRKWPISNVMELKAGKKKRLQLSEKKKTGYLEARKCTCPGELVLGQKYLIFSQRKMRKNKLAIKTMEQGARSGKDAIIPLNEIQKLGQFFQILFPELQS